MLVLKWNDWDPPLTQSNRPTNGFVFSVGDLQNPNYSYLNLYFSFKYFVLDELYFVSRRIVHKCQISWKFINCMNHATMRMKSSKYFPTCYKYILNHRLVSIMLVVIILTFYSKIIDINNRASQSIQVICPGFSRSISCLHSFGSNKKVTILVFSHAHFPLRVPGTLSYYRFNLFINF